MRAITTASAIALLLVWAANGSVAREVRSTNDFIKVCDEAVPSTACLVQYLTAVEALEWLNDPRFKNCVPDTTTLSSKEADIELRNEVRAIVPWLKKHPDLGTAKYSSSILAAIRAIYPCP